MTEMNESGGAYCTRARFMTKSQVARHGRFGVMLAVALFLAGADMGIPSVAHAQTSLHELTWAHPTPSNVARFVVYAGKTKGDKAGARTINVGKPANPVQSGDVFVYSAVISVALDEYVAVAAVSYDGSVSALSAWSGLPPSEPGQPYYIP